MQPYVIKQGDYLAKLAYQFAFEADVVWNDPSNAPLRQVRSNPNILYPTDVLYIPDQVNKTPQMQGLATGTTNTFVTDPPTETVTLRFLDPACASQACTVQELPQLAGLVTDANGSVSFAVPVSLEALTVIFTNTGSTYPLLHGHVDPINTLSGIFQRLQNLGYIDVDTALYAPDMDLIRGALRGFKAAQPGATPAAADSTPTDTSAPADDPGNAPTPSDASGGSSASDLSPPPESDTGTSSPSEPASSPDDAGLSDDGTLDDATSQLLVAAHGS